MKNLWVVVCIFMSSILQAQTGSFASMDSYLPLAGSELNPAMAAESRGAWVFSPLKADFGIQNNFFSLNMPYSPYKLLTGNVPKQYKTQHGNPYWDWTWVQMTGDVPTIQMQAFARTSGPSVLWKKGKYVWSFRSDATGFLFADGLPAQIVKEEINQWNADTGKPSVQKIIAANPNNAPSSILLSQQSYVGLSVGLARRFQLIRSKDIAIGINYRVLHSMGGYFMNVKTANLIYDSENGVNVKAPSVYFAEMRARRNRLWAHGLGSADIGVVYTYRNVETRRPGDYAENHPDYKFKFGWSLLDIGNLTYTRTIVTSVSMKSDVELPDPEEFEGLTQEEIIDKYKRSFQNELGISNNMTYGKTIKVGLPTRMAFSMDMQLSKHLFWSNLWMQNLRRVNKNNMVVNTFISSGLRWEYKYFGMGVPLTYSHINRKVSMGANFRMGPWFFGTANLGPFLKPKGTYGATLFFGVQITDLPGTVFKKKMPYMFTRKRNCAQF